MDLPGVFFRRTALYRTANISYLCTSNLPCFPGGKNNIDPRSARDIDRVVAVELISAARHRRERRQSSYLSQTNAITVMSREGHRRGCTGSVRGFEK